MAISELDKTRARIIEAAGTVFAQKGFEGATVREICHLAQANLAAVNYYFGDKQRLYVEAVKRAHCSRTELAPPPHWEPGTPPEQKLADFVRMLLTRMLSGSDTWHPQLMLREISRPTPACEELVRDYIRPHFEMLEGIVRELAPGIASDVTRHLIVFGIVGQCLHFRVAQPVVARLVEGQEYSTYTPAMLAQHITNWTLAALGLKPSFGQAGGPQ